MRQAKQVGETCVSEGFPSWNTEHECGKPLSSLHQFLYKRGVTWCLAVQSLIPMRQQWRFIPLRRYFIYENQIFFWKKIIKYWLFTGQKNCLIYKEILPQYYLNSKIILHIKNIKLFSKMCFMPSSLGTHVLY